MKIIKNVINFYNFFHSAENKENPRGEDFRRIKLLKYFSFHLAWSAQSSQSKYAPFCLCIFIISDHGLSFAYQGSLIQPSEMWGFRRIIPKGIQKCCLRIAVGSVKIGFNFQQKISLMRGQFPNISAIWSGIGLIF